MKIVLIGCGHKTAPQFEFCNDAIYLYRGNADAEITRLDISPDCNPDILFDMNDAQGNVAGLSGVDEIHAYEVWEHFGRQGDVEGFFRQADCVAASLKPGGLFYVTCPRHDSVWAFGDPQHCRVIPRVMWDFLSPRMYDQVGKTACSDYRSLLKNDWSIIASQDISDDNYLVILRYNGPLDTL